MSITKFTQAVQIKLWQFTNSFESEFSKPEHKFIRQSLFGLLKGGQTQINTIGRSLQEKISTKKVAKRLSYHLVKGDMADKINRSIIKAQKHRLASCRYLILDGSDIVKEYAKKMEGLSKVHDGSKHEISNGYWLCNVTAVNKDGSSIILLYSELYSHQKEHVGENGKILKAIDQVMAYAPKDLIWVMDRTTLYDALDAKGYHYIIRQVRNRHLMLNGKEMKFNEIVKKVRLDWEFKGVRISKNRKQSVYIKAGAIKVKRVGSEKEIWLVVLKYRNGGYSWYLLSKDGLNEGEAIQTVFEG